MANPKHLEILMQGVASWNRWRMNNPGLVPDLVEAQLSAANLIGANFGKANLAGANLVGANLGKAGLWGADLRGAKLGDANLSGVDFTGANLRGAHLGGADLTGAIILSTTFGDDDMSNAKGLETAHHGGPSTIGIDTIYKSKGNIPEVFLRGCGVPEDFILYTRSWVGKALEFYSCFISYSSKDNDFAQRLYADLQAQNVRCWEFDENAKWSEPAWSETDRPIRLYDKLVVICSENSLQTQPVIREIERALRRENRENKNILFPVRIDDYLFEKWDHPRKADVVSKIVGDFRVWKDHDAYQKAFARLLGDLKAEKPSAADAPAPPAP
jgi:uncharacterized protein YjbI with pentapeptide repeats